MQQMVFVQEYAGDSPLFELHFCQNKAVPAAPPHGAQVLLPTTAGRPPRLWEVVGQEWQWVNLREGEGFSYGWRVVIRVVSVAK